MTGPLSPKQLVSLKEKRIPDEVFEAFNELIAESWNGHSSNFTLRKVVTRIVDKGIPRNEIFEKHYLDIEKIYEKKGWSVEYDQPGYNETYEANFTFSVKR